MIIVRGTRPESLQDLIPSFLSPLHPGNEVTDEYLSFIAVQLNNRPRRNLGYASPNEIFTKEVGIIAIKMV